MNTSLVLMSMGIGGFLFVMFYVLKNYFEFPGLNPLGRNTLLVIMINLIIDMVVWDLIGIQDITNEWPFAPFLAIVSIIITYIYYYLILVPINRKEWYFTSSVFLRSIPRIKNWWRRQKKH